MTVYDDIMRQFDAMAVRSGRLRAVDRLQSLRLPARREYITASEYNALIDAIVEAMG